MADNAREGWRDIATLVHDGRCLLVGVWVEGEHGWRWSFWDTIADGGPLGCDGEWGDAPTHYAEVPEPPPTTPEAGL
jgi:hypothetical protein